MSSYIQQFCVDLITYPFPKLNAVNETPGNPFTNMD